MPPLERGQLLQDKSSNVTFLASVNLSQISWTTRAVPAAKVPCVKPELREGLSTWLWWQRGGYRKTPRCRVTKKAASLRHRYLEAPTACTPSAKAATSHHLGEVQLCSVAGGCPGLTAGAAPSSSSLGSPPHAVCSLLHVMVLPASASQPPPVVAVSANSRTCRGLAGRGGPGYLPHHRWQL